MATVTIAEFNATRHARVDAGISTVVKSCAQDYMPKTTVARGAGKHRQEQIHRPKNTGQVRRTKNAAENGGGHGKSSECWTKSTRHADAKNATLQGLCNRCSAGSTAKLIPCFNEYLSRTGDVKGVVTTIMSSVARSDTYTDVYVEILRGLESRCGNDVHDRIRERVDEFVDTRPHLVHMCPDPEKDYEGFCAYVARKSKTIRTTAALSKLGFARVLSKLFEPALDELADPGSDYDKDSAVKFMHACLSADSAPHDGCGIDPVALASLAKRTRDLSERADVCNIDHRARFALLDLSQLARRVSNMRKA